MFFLCILLICKLRIYTNLKNQMQYLLFELSEILFSRYFLFFVFFMFVIILYSLSYVCSLFSGQIHIYIYIYFIFILFLLKKSKC